MRADVDRFLADLEAARVAVPASIVRVLLGAASSAAAPAAPAVARRDPLAETRAALATAARVAGEHREPAQAGPRGGRNEAEAKRVRRRVAALVSAGTICPEAAARLRVLPESELEDAIRLATSECVRHEDTCPSDMADTDVPNPDADVPNSDATTPRNLPSEAQNEGSETRGVPRGTPASAPAPLVRLGACLPEEDNSCHEVTSGSGSSALVDFFPIEISSDTTSQATRDAREPARESAQPHARAAREREISRSEGAHDTAREASADPPRTLPMGVRPDMADAADTADTDAADTDAHPNHVDPAEGAAQNSPRCRVDAADPIDPTHQEPIAAQNARGEGDHAASIASREVMREPGDDTDEIAAEGHAAPSASPASGGAPMDDGQDHTGERAGKRVDGAAWTLVDHYARTFEAETKQPATFARPARGRHTIKRHRWLAYDAAARCLSSAKELAPLLDITGRMELVRLAMRLHLAEGRPWLDLGGRHREAIVAALESRRQAVAEEHAEREKRQADADRATMAEKRRQDLARLGFARESAFVE